MSSCYISWVIQRECQPEKQQKWDRFWHVMVLPVHPTARCHRSEAHRSTRLPPQVDKYVLTVVTGSVEWPSCTSVWSKRSLFGYEKETVVFFLIWGNVVLSLLFWLCLVMILELCFRGPTSLPGFCRDKVCCCFALLRFLFNQRATTHLK